ncbi:molybdopterin-dependent oxidoreductase [Nocardioides marinquilinus]|uniref:molybdopterin-dependent oxidoreductase n=1 Tax=Nocardioides marinquilinus TaxID=1210400 RepID=UPI0031E54706
MRRSRVAWVLAGLMAGYAGLAVAYLVAELINLRLDPVNSVAELVRDVMPADVVNWSRENLGTDSKHITFIIIIVVVTVFFAGIGLLARRAWWLGVVGFGVMALIYGAAALSNNGASSTSLLPAVVGYLVMVGALWLLTQRLARLQALPDTDVYGEAWHRRRREFLVVTAAVVATAAVSSLLARLAGRDVRGVEQDRKTKNRQVSAPEVPDGARLDVEGAAAWMTPVAEFYLIDTAFVKPAIRYRDWQLRIHGMVENEIVLDFEDLVARGVDEAWITLNCVSNEVGGDLIGNAWFSGVLLGPLLAEAKPLAGADAVLQTSDDGWTCGTPLTALTDGRNAMLAIAMNGEPLTIEHGFPVRTVVPGLYGYVSATKWVVDMEVTTFGDIEAYWTQRGWGELGPVKMSSRIEVPSDGGQVAAGPSVVAGSAWSQHTGISKVEVSVDGGPWQACELGTVPSTDTWVQWRLELDLAEGDHTAVVRATDKDGQVQTSVVADVLPDGATGWHDVSFSAAAGT